MPVKSVRSRTTGWEYTGQPEFHRRLDYVQRLVVAAKKELFFLPLCEASYLKSQVIRGLLGFCVKAISMMQPKPKDLPNANK